MGGYWFQPSITASAARCRTSSGPRSSGKPWPRLTAPVSRASRDMVSNTVVGRSAKMGFMRGETVESSPAITRAQAGTAAAVTRSVQPGTRRNVRWRTDSEPARRMGTDENLQWSLVSLALVQPDRRPPVEISQRPLARFHLAVGPVPWMACLGGRRVHGPRLADRTASLGALMVVSLVACQ